VVPVNTAIPTITGTATIGSTISATNGTWSNSPTSYRYQWQKSESQTSGWTNITDETNSTLTVIGDFDGFYLRVAVWASNVYGESGNPAYSDPTALVSADIGLYNGLKAYWKLDEASGTRVDSKDGFDLTDDYSVGYGVGVINNGAVLDGSQTLSSSPTNFSIQNGLTISFWVKSTLGGTQVGVGFYVGTNAVYVGWLPDGNVFGDLGHGVDGYSSQSNGNIQDDIWSHVVLRADPVAETWTAVVDGTFVTRVLPASLNPDPTGSIKVGSNRDGVTSEPMTGMLDEVGIWNRALTDAEIEYLYNSGAGRQYEALALNSDLKAFWKLEDLTDSSGNAYTLTNNNGVSFSTGKIGDCADFSAGSWFTADPIPLTGRSATISYWVKTPTMTGGFGGYSLPFNTNSCIGGYIAAVGGAHPAGCVAVDVVYDGSTVNRVQGDIPIDDDTWNHVCLISDGITGKLYINNVLDQEETLVSGAFEGNDSSTAINGNTDGSFGAAAIKFDAMGVWNRALSDAERNYIYNSGNGIEPF
jgi:hypothetical protein